MSPAVFWLMWLAMVCIGVLAWAAVRSTRLYRPMVEVYVRTIVEVGNYTFEPAVEFIGTDLYDDLVNRLRALALAAEPLDDRASAMHAAKKCARLIRKYYPDRAYFVEVWQNGKAGFAQVFQPYGLPRNR